MAASKKSASRTRKSSPKVKVQTQRPPAQYMGKKMKAHMKLISVPGNKNKTPTKGGK